MSSNRIYNKQHNNTVYWLIFSDLTKCFLLIAQLPALASESCHLDRLADVLPPDYLHLHHHNLHPMHPMDWLAQQQKPHHAGGGREECHSEGTKKYNF